ncbi:YfhL family 4Fe-4S dicluster ferredoxin [Chloroflexota bacterium]
MAYKITDECISCGACEPDCRNGAIREGETIFEVDYSRCTECVGWYSEPKCAEVCPVDACVPDPDRKETREELLARWQAQNPGKTPEAT